MSFWDEMREAAAYTRGMPAWAKAGINLTERHYITYVPSLRAEGRNRHEKDQEDASNHP